MRERNLESSLGPLVDFREGVNPSISKSSQVTILHYCNGLQLPVSLLIRAFMVNTHEVLFNKVDVNLQLTILLFSCYLE